MSNSDFVVPPRSWDSIGQLTDTIRANFSLTSVAKFPIIDFIEKVLDQRFELLTFCVGEYWAMDGAEGHVDPVAKILTLREDVYLAACQGEGRARFTAAHELGHFVMHSGPKLQRAPSGMTVPRFQLSEPQADQFAAELLMPRMMMRSTDTEADVMSRHGVSKSAAANRIRFLRSKGLI